MSSTKNAKNAKSRGHASGHEARSDFAGSGNSAQVVEKAAKTASLGGGGAVASLPVVQATTSNTSLTAAYSSPPPPPDTPYPGSSSSAMQRPPPPKDDYARSSITDASVGASGRVADAEDVRDRSPLRHQDERAGWQMFQKRQEAMQARQEAIHISLIQSMQGLAHSLSTQQQLQQQHYDSQVAQGPLSG